MVSIKWVAIAGVVGLALKRRCEPCSRNFSRTIAAQRPLNTVL